MPPLKALVSKPVISFSSMTICTGGGVHEAGSKAFQAWKPWNLCAELPTSHPHWAQVHATQFHPEKSGGAGLDILRAFLDASEADLAPEPALPPSNGVRHLRSDTCACDI